MEIYRLKKYVWYGNNEKHSTYTHTQHTCIQKEVEEEKP